MLSVTIAGSLVKCIIHVHVTPLSLLKKKRGAEWPREPEYIKEIW